MYDENMNSNIRIYEDISYITLKTIKHPLTLVGKRLLLYLNYVNMVLVLLK